MSSGNRSSSPHYVKGQGTHSMSDSPYYEKFPSELKKLRRSASKSKTPKNATKKCPPNKVINPKTKRCINKNGRLAKTLKKKGKL